MSGRLGTDSRFLETLFSAGTTCGLTDAQLLEQFVARHDETAEATFESLVLRHGSMVFDISLKILGNTHDAQDAFQATFLILATRASSIMRRGSVASWLHGVALRVARRARSDSARRHAHEKQIAEMTSSEVEPRSADNGHDYEMLHDEVERLPRKYREAVVLCYLEGMSLEAASGQLGCPIGTVGVRLMRARERLRIRLSAGRMSVPAGLLVAGTAARSASAALPAALVGSTVNSVMHKATVGIVSLAAAKITSDVLGSMVRSKLSKTVMGVIVALVAVGLVGGFVVHFGMFNASQRQIRNPKDALASLIGQQVVTKYGALVTTGNQVANPRRDIYTVKEVDGERVRLVSKDGSGLDSKSVTGWIESKRIVLFDQAITFYTNELLVNSNNAKAHFERGVIWSCLQKLDEAIGDFTYAISLDPKNRDGYERRADAYFEKKNYDKAIADYTEAIRLDLSFAYPFLARGRAWNDTGEYGKAIADYSEAIRLDPQATVFDHRGHALICKGEYDKAIADFTEAIRLDPSDAYAYKTRATVWERKSDYDKAIADYTESVRLDPKSADGFQNRGNALMRKGQFDKAVADFTEAIRLDPTDAYPYVCRAAAWEAERQNFYNDKNHEKIIADLTEAIRLAPTAPDAYDRLARFLNRIPDNQFHYGRKAVESATQACELSKWNEPAYLLTLAAACAIVGESELAAKWDKKAALIWEKQTDDLRNDDEDKSIRESRLKPIPGTTPFRLDGPS